MLMSPIYGQVCAVEWSCRPRHEHFYRTGEFDKYELKQAVLDPANRQGDLSFLLEFGRDRPKSLASTDMHTHKTHTRARNGKAANGRSSSLSSDRPRPKRALFFEGTQGEKILDVETSHVSLIMKPFLKAEGGGGENAREADVEQEDQAAMFPYSARLNLSKDGDQHGHRSGSGAYSTRPSGVLLNVPPQSIGNVSDENLLRMLTSLATPLSTPLSTPRKFAPNETHTQTRQNTQITDTGRELSPHKQSTQNALPMQNQNVHVKKIQETFDQTTWKEIKDTGGRREAEGEGRAGSAGTLEHPRSFAVCVCDFVCVCVCVCGIPS